MISKVNMFVTALVLVSSVFASDQRINALGGNAGFWPEDDQNVYMFPATMHNFNIAQIQDVSGSSKATFLFGEGTKYGFMMEDSSSAASDALVNFAYGSGSWGLLLGLDMDSQEAGETKTSESTISASFGMATGFGEVGLHFKTMSTDDGSADTDDASGMHLGFDLRRDQALWEFSHMLFSFDMNSSDYAEESQKSKSDMTMKLDFFRHWTLAESSDLLFSLGFVYASSSEETIGDPNTKTDNSQIWLPNFTFAVETNLLEWATVRAGVNNTHVLSNSTKTTEGSTTTEGSDNGTSIHTLMFGLGLKYGGFNLDIDLAPAFFTDPVNFITGNNIADDLATKATITYAW